MRYIPATARTRYAAPASLVDAAEEWATAHRDAVVIGPAVDDSQWTEDGRVRREIFHGGAVLGAVDYIPRPLIWSGADGDTPRPYEALSSGQSEHDSLEAAVRAVMVMSYRYGSPL